MNASKITPCLWFDTQAEEAAGFYASIFRDGAVGAATRYPEGGMMPAGGVMTVRFTVAGQPAIALNGGPYFKFTPASSFFVGCESAAELDALWDKLIEGGFALMEREAMPPFERYGWLQDRYGFSWQLGVCGCRQYVTPFLMFTGPVYRKAAEAVEFWRSTFAEVSVQEMVLAGKSNPYGIAEGDVIHARFNLCGQDLMAMDSGYDHKFNFTEAFSFYVECASQAEIDYFWDALGADGGEGECGWMKDRFGVWWQIVPDTLESMTDGSDPVRTKRVMDALLKMHKIDMAALQEVYDGR